MIRQTVAFLVTLNVVLSLLGIAWFPFLLVVQGLVSVAALSALYFWIAQLDDDLEKVLLKYELDCAEHAVGGFAFWATVRSTANRFSARLTSPA